MNRRALLRYLFVCAILCTALFKFTAGYAQEGTPSPSDDEVNAIARQMYCPVCENIPLDVCNTQACSQWRELIREKLALGWNTEQIKAYFVAQYGDRVLAVPPIKGGADINILVYAIPVIVMLVGLVFLVRLILRASPKTDLQENAKIHPITPEQEKALTELELELQRKKKERKR